MNDSGWNMYVFRDGRKRVRGTELANELLRWLETLSDCPGESSSLGALIAAGELECALADANCQSSDVGRITDALAADLLGMQPADPHRLSAVIAQVQLPDSVTISVAEGFAFYALHPLRFAEPVSKLLVGAPIRVIGVRSIGTTLSAVVSALCTMNGVPAERITVRPTGHPYDRQLQLTDAQQAWLRGAGPEGTVVIVDEGPGLSGSSFLSVAEAVERAGVPAQRIVMLGSRTPECSELRAPDAVRRWPKYRFLTASPDPILPEDAAIDISGGVWRHHFLEDFRDQPAAWTQLEAAKYLTSDRRSIYKFHGYGRFAEATALRSAASAEHGFSPAWLGMVRGFGKYEVAQGRLLTPGDLSPDVLQRAAQYCAFRASEIKAKISDTSEIESMAKWNWQCEFNSEISGLQLPVERLVIPDARMLPHEWIRTQDGRVLKLDASTHGDDHFFPGACDIAWDLAGMIIEWELDPAMTESFLRMYHAASGDDPADRIADHLLAYSIFRMSWSKMAASASAGTFDEKLLLRDYMRYRDRVIWLSRSSEVLRREEIAEAPALKPAVAF